MKSSSINSFIRVVSIHLSLFSVALAAAVGCATRGKRESIPPSHDRPLAVIDVHVHPDFTGKQEPSSGIPQTREEFVEEMREANVVGGVALEEQDGKPFTSDLESLGLVRCAGVGKRVDVVRIERGLKSGFYRCIKIYLGYVHQYASDANYQPAYRLAERYDVPVVFHTGDTYDEDGKLKYSDPLTIDEVAVDHRKVDFVIAHCGNPWIQSAAEVAYKNPNVYLDGSAFLIGHLRDKPADSVQRLMIEPLAWIFAYVENPQKLMYGTDWPLVRMPDYLRAFQQAIPRQHWQAVFHDNAVRVFRLDRKVKK